VVIAAFNAAPWIGETLESVQAQSFQDYEIIVVDDGSSDETARIVSQFEKVRYLSQANRGTASARNLGVRAARGDYVAFLDADDLWSPDKLLLQMELIDQTGSVWVFSDAYAFDNDTRLVQFTFGQVRRQYSGTVLQQLFLGDFIPMPTPIVKRSVFEQVGYFDEVNLRRKEDWEMWLRIAARYPVARVDRPLAYYRVHPSSKTQSSSPAILYATDLAVIELAALREPERLARLKNRSVARSCVRVGKFAARRKELSEARGFFARSIHLAPFEFEAYAYWLGTFGGTRLADAYVTGLHWMQRKRSVSSHLGPTSPVPRSGGRWISK
jgi:glycosyltransferase involved in cell wall biosynthesis